MESFRQGLVARLQSCVQWAGGKRTLAALCDISEAQLYRYLAGTVVPPADTLARIAKECGMDAGWLLTGEGKDRREGALTAHPPFRPALMLQVMQTFDELLVESDKRFTPVQRSRATTLIYEALRHREWLESGTLEIDRRLAPFYPDFLAPLRADSRLEDYLTIFGQLEYGGKLSVQTLQQFDSLVRTATLGAYEGSAGEIYFEKMGTQLLPEAAKALTELANEAIKKIGRNDLTWLDLGCGNGRHLAFLTRHMPNMHLHGVEASKLALHLCKQLVKAAKIPIGVVEEGDFRALPLADASVDVVYCRMGLSCLPYFADVAVGAAQLMAEVARVLRPGGMAWFLTFAGSRCDYVPFVQYHDEESIRALAEQANLKVVKIAETPANETGGVAGQDYSRRLNKAVAFTLTK